MPSWSQRLRHAGIRAFPNLYRSLAKCSPGALPPLTGPRLRVGAVESNGGPVNRKHAFTISLAAAIAAIAGVFAATKSVHLGHSATAPATATSSVIASRTAALDRTEAPCARRSRRSRPSSRRSRPGCRRGRRRRAAARPARRSTSGRRRASSRSTATAGSTRTNAWPRAQSTREAASMTNHVARLYALVAAVLVFFVAWAAIAAHPWQTRAGDVRPAASPRCSCASSGCGRSRSPSSGSSTGAGRPTGPSSRSASRRSRRSSRGTPRHALPRRRSASAPAAPSVRVVTLPPLTITRTS